MHCPATTPCHPPRNVPPSGPQSGETVAGSTCRRASGHVESRRRTPADARPDFVTAVEFARTAEDEPALADSLRGLAEFDRFHGTRVDSRNSFQIARRLCEELHDDFGIGQCRI